ncbi:MAG: glycosyltransferase [Bacteroidota bacterium]
MLLSPLNWGAGHATRDIPVINMLLEKGCRVFVACSGELQNILSSEIEGITFVRLPEMHIKYNRRMPLWLKLLIQIPSFIKVVYAEYRAVKKLVSQYSLDAIISDNRYGVRHKSVCSVIITHQLHIETPGMLSPFSYLANRINRFFISGFDMCWIPDEAPPNHLSGKLSNPEHIKIPFQYTGILSRFTAFPQKEERQVLVMVSGPEPQRTVFRELVFNQALKTTGRVIIVASNATTRIVKHAVGRIEIINSPKQDQLNKLILQSKYIVARAGYSSIMELVSLKKQAILVPTPGQPEQEYLARWMTKYGFVHIPQHELNLDEDILRIRSYLPEKEQWPEPQNAKLSDCIDDVIANSKT